MKAYNRESSTEDHKNGSEDVECEEPVLLGTVKSLGAATRVNDPSAGAQSDDANDTGKDEKKECIFIGDVEDHGCLDDRGN